MTSPFAKTVVEIPKSLRNSLGKKKWVLVLSVREFGTTSNLNGSAVKVQSKRNKRINGKKESTATINTGMIPAKALKGKSGKKPDQTIGKRKTGKPTKLQMVGPKTKSETEMSESKARNKPNKRDKLIATRNDMTAASHAQDEKKEEEFQEEVSKLAKKYGKAVLESALLRGPKSD